MQPCQKVPKSDFQRQFSMSKTIFLLFFHLIRFGQAFIQTAKCLTWFSSTLEIMARVGLDQTGSNLFRLVQTCSNLIKMDQIESNLNKVAEN